VDTSRFERRQVGFEEQSRLIETHPIVSVKSMVKSS
jgi:hypothetical protein